MVKINSAVSLLEQHYRVYNSIVLTLILAMLLFIALGRRITVRIPGTVDVAIVDVTMSGAYGSGHSVPVAVKAWDTTDRVTVREW
jgi:hypothetical protein